MTKFVHLRCSTWDNQLSPVGGATIAYQFNTETREASYFVAHCNDREHYNRKIGRKIAVGRLAKYGGVHVTIPQGRKVADAIVEHFVLGEIKPFETLVYYAGDTAPSSTEVQ